MLAMTDARPPRLSGPLVAAAGYFLPRLMFLNTRYAPQVHWGDVVRALDGLGEQTALPPLGSAEFWEEWRRRWLAQAAGHLHRADTAATPVGAARACRAAAACLHWAEFMDFDDPVRKHRVRARTRATFRRSLAALHPVTDAEFVEGVLTVPGLPDVPYWVVLPPAGRRDPGPLPAVLLSNGLDSMTEVEILSLAEAYLERGLAAVLFDGPGQGIHVGRTPLLVEMETVVAALVDRLGRTAPLDPDRLAFGGVSFGGYLALRVAQSPVGERFAAVVNLGGGPRVAPFPRLPRRLADDFAFALGGGTGVAELGAATAAARVAALALDPHRPPRTDVLSVHGALDDIFPVAALRELDRAWGARHRLVVHEREAHVCLTRIDQTNQDAADWVARRLGAGTATRRVRERWGTSDEERAMRSGR